MHNHAAEKCRLFCSQHQEWSGPCLFKAMTSGCTGLVWVKVNCPAGYVMWCSAELSGLNSRYEINLLSDMTSLSYNWFLFSRRTCHQFLKERAGRSVGYKCLNTLNKAQRGMCACHICKEHLWELWFYKQWKPLRIQWVSKLRDWEIKEQNLKQWAVKWNTKCGICFSNIMSIQQGIYATNVYGKSKNCFIQGRLKVHVDAKFRQHKVTLKKFYFHFMY